MKRIFLAAALMVGAGAFVACEERQEAEEQEAIGGGGLEGQTDVQQIDQYGEETEPPEQGTGGAGTQTTPGGTQTPPPATETQPQTQPAPEEGTGGAGMQDDSLQGTDGGTGGAGLDDTDQTTEPQQQSLPETQPTE